MKYGILKENKFDFISDNVDEIKNTIPFLPQYTIEDIKEYQDDEVELSSVDNCWYLKGFAPVKPLEEIRAEKLAEINQAYTQEATYVKLGTPEDEVSTWDIQRLEAQAWQKDNTVATPFLTELALKREVERVWLIGKVLEKVAAFEVYMAGLTGKRQKYEDRIKAATLDNINDIVWG